MQLYLGSVSAVLVTIFTCIITPSLSFQLVRSAGDGPSFCHGFDCPKFSVVEKKGAYEVRKYEPSKWVGTTISSMNWTSALNEGYSRLYKYRIGENQGGIKLPMATPVAAKIVPGQGPACESNFTILFFVPFKYQSSTPVPTDSQVAVVDLPALTAYVASFSGFETELKLQEEASDFDLALENDKREFIKDYYFTAEYDSPDQKTDRHNEVWFLAA